MDDGCASITKEQVSLTDIIDNVVSERQFIANAKGIIIEDNIARQVTMNGNASLLEAIFNNLIDNAAAYSGGSSITIGLTYEDEDKIILSFSDNGSGVPEEHLTKIFERFYRIDKGRSRAARRHQASDCQ